MTWHNSPAHAQISPVKFGNLQTENMIIIQIMTIDKFDFKFDFIS